MTPEKHEQLTELFHAALEVASDERAVFLLKACDGDAELRREVDSLLAAHGQGAHTAKPPADIAAGLYQAQQDQGAVGGVAREGTLAPHTRLDRYEIRSLLGKGGMGEVYLAEDTRLNRNVALKILPAASAQDAGRMRRFVQEAKAASALNHPNILTIYEAGEFENKNYIASEYVEGETLSERLRREPLNQKAALDVAIQITSALQAAHAVGIVHRDIKPDNVMIRPDGVVKLLDFGIAKLTEQKIGLLDAEAATAIKVNTQTGTLIGTAAYMSPEQARGNAVDARSDIFSFGLVLYEMLTGKRAFAGENAMDVISSILQKEPVPLRRLIPEVPHELERIVGKALRKDCEERYQTAKDLLIDLKDARQELEFQNQLDRASVPYPEQGKTQIINAAATDAVQITSSTQSLTAKITNHKLAAIATLLVLMVGIAALYYFRPGNVSNKQASGVAIDSLAVLPFINASGNSELEYLSDGMTDILITSLSQLPQLSVKARSSVFRYKGKDASPQQVGKELGVQAILTGRLVQHGNDVTLHIELVDVQKETALWSADYSRSGTNLAALQSEIARDVSANLRSRLTSTEQQRLAKSGTENAEAYRAYLKGLYYWHKSPAPGFEKSREYFQQAIDLDPTYAPAYAGLAVYYGFSTTIGLLPPNEGWPKVEAATNKALALDDTLAENYNPMGAIKLYYYRDWPAAERAFRRGIELDPNYAELHLHYGIVLAQFGRAEEAITEAQRAIEIDPLSVRSNGFLARIFFFTRQYDRAIDQLRKTLEMDPNYTPAYEDLGDIYEQKGLQEDAVAEWGKSLTLKGAGEQASILKRTYAASGFQAAVRALAQAQLEKLNDRTKRGEYVAAHEYVTAYTRLGDKEQAFAWFDKAVQERNGFVFAVRVIPIYDKLRDDPRFQASLRKVGF